MQTVILLAVYTIYFLPNLNHFFFCTFSFEVVASSSCCDLDCLDLPDCSERREYLDLPDLILLEPMVDCLLESSSSSELCTLEYLPLDASWLYRERLDLAVDLDCLLLSSSDLSEYRDL